MNSLFNFPKIYTRSTRLYFNEDPKNVCQNKLCLHAQGRSSGSKLSKKIIDKVFPQNFFRLDFFAPFASEKEKDALFSWDLSKSLF